jgi:hypothetical protein
MEVVGRKRKRMRKRKGQEERDRWEEEGGRRWKRSGCE